MTGGAFTCLLTTDDRLQQLNRDFLDHDYPTDVLSFPAAGIPDADTLACRVPDPGDASAFHASRRPGRPALRVPQQMLGDIAISVERAAEQAAAFGHTIEQEIEILMLHGALHLLGMDHENDRGRMARAESRWRRTLDLPRGLIARARKHK
ncbi:MAG: rRNA maturation RNase YbeY [Bryobacterales bacterium]|nr:rRNA maturation RNase YbeY [Bryobacterales bacterium]